MVTSYARFLEGQARRGRTSRHDHIALRSPGRLTGLRHTIYEHPITHKFALIRLPEDFADGDAIPVGATDRWFDTVDGPVAALSELLDAE